MVRNRNTFEDTVTVKCDPQSAHKGTTYDCTVFHKDPDVDDEHGTATDDIQVKGVALDEDIELRDMSDFPVVVGGSSYRSGPGGVNFYLNRQECYIDAVDRLVCKP